MAFSTLLIMRRLCMRNISFRRKTMNQTKRMSVLFLALCCSFTLIVPTYASATEPMAEGTKAFQATLSIDFNGEAFCCVIANASSISYKITVVMSLTQLGNPIPLKSWSASGTGTLSMSNRYYVPHGYDYQVTATITVRDSAGKFIESFTTTSATVHY